MLLARQNCWPRCILSQGKYFGGGSVEQLLNVLSMKKGIQSRNILIAPHCKADIPAVMRISLFKHTY